ncbi:hypothetical protein CA265_24710 [Sphingobacteriaceae bacterium GW460-11-11-14-LB5]|nr:hypothetical protein CA265_24710 [Sphingobacteriaceae bacterium GW460-11-11-14-LB5]
MESSFSGYWVRFRPALPTADEKSASVRSGLDYTCFCTDEGFPCHCPTHLALIEAEILFCQPEQSGTAKKIGAQSRTNDNIYAAAALQINQKVLTH